MGFVPLQVISTYSLLHSNTTINGLVTAAKERGYQAMALTDVNVMYAVVAFYNAAKQAGIKPLLGLQLSLQAPSGEAADDLVVIAQDLIGYQNLMQLSTLAQTRDTPLSFDEGVPYFDHLSVIIANRHTIHRQLADGNQNEAITILTAMRTAITPSKLYLGISDQVSQIYADVAQQVSDQSGVPLVALPEVRYLNQDDAFAVNVLQAIEQNTTIERSEEAQRERGMAGLKTAAEYEQTFEQLGLGKASRQTEQIAEASDVTLQFSTPQLPAFDTPNQQSSKDYLRTLCEQGLTQRLQDEPDADREVYLARLNHELESINRLGFDDYFLIVWDVMNFAHTHQITTGPGRGSAAGSLVAYVLAITDVDPIQYDLLFERFLNEERAQMPDIDLDIPDNRREDVLDYVHQKYGHERVAQIITFGTLAAKQAIRDVGRVFGLSTFEMNTWSAAIPTALHITLEQAFNDSQKLQNLIADSSKNQLLFDTAKRIEGLPRHYSTHAAGVVLSNQPLVKTVPLQNGSETMMMTQYAKETVEAVGLLKMDFLGLRNLSLLADALANVKRQGVTNFDITKIDLNDPETLALFASGNTNGVFQFESSGIKNVLRKLKPDSFELVAAVNALYRPGPMENIDHFIARKNGSEPVDYLDPSLEPILGRTYGILVYQEQVMQVASSMGGFSMGQADLLRRAMSKKKKQTIDEMKRAFVEGAGQKGIQTGTAEQVYDYIERFANYGFNRSHAVAYSKMAFELAYLKVHYSAAFFAALLNSVWNNAPKTKAYLMEAKQLGVPVGGPDINRSAPGFSLQDGTLLFGLISIKGIRRDFMREILNERREGGRFKGLLDFLQRLDVKWLKRETISALIYAGAFDQFGENRATLIEALPEMLSSVELSGKSMSLFEELAPKMTPQPDFTLNEKLAQENEYLGAYLSGHPVEQYLPAVANRNFTSISDLSVDMKASVLMYVTKVRVIRTKRGQQMAFVSGNDLTGDLSLTLFPNAYTKVMDWLKPEMVVAAAGKVQQQRDLELLVDQLIPADELLTETSGAKPNQRWVLRIDRDHESMAVMQTLNAVIAKHPGDVPVLLFQVSNDQKRLLDSSKNLATSDATFNDLATVIGHDNVVLQSHLHDDN